MQVMTRRLLVISAIALGGGMTGLALGNFVAGSERTSGADELASFVQSSNSQDAAMLDESTFANPASTARNGPTSYDCKGCDAGLHARDDVVDLSPVEPMSPYDPYADTEPSGQPQEPPPLTRERGQDQGDARIGAAPLIVE